MLSLILPPTHSPTHSFSHPPILPPTHPQALYRIVEPSAGRIVIDGIDTATIGLYDLRSRLALVPQVGGQ